MSLSFTSTQMLAISLKLKCSVFLQNAKKVTPELKTGLTNLNQSEWSNLL